MDNDISPNPFTPDVVVPTPQTVAQPQVQPVAQAPQAQFIAQPISSVPPSVEQPYRPPADSPPPIPMGSLVNQADPIRQAAQAANLVAPATPPSAQEQAAFDDEINGWADKKTISGVTFYYNVFDDETKKALKRAPHDLAAALGIPYKWMRDGKDADGKEIQLTDEQQDIQEQMGSDLQLLVITNALRSWSAPRRCDAENIAKLLPHMKRELSEAIISFSLNGVTEARFRLGLVAMSQKE